MNAGQMTPRGCTLGRGWKVVSTMELGTTARVFVLSNGRGQLALKAARVPEAVPTLCAEHALLHALNRTAMAPFVPTTGPWLADLDGFTMTWLRCPTATERAAPSWIAQLAHALHTLHTLPLPEGLSLADDRFVPGGPGAAYGARVRRALDGLADGPEHWRWLDAVGRGALGRLRTLTATYAALLPEAVALLDSEPAALTHGDLAGDNLMAFADGSLALADWGTARIGARLTDVASLAVYAEWDEATLQTFLDLYAPEDGDLRTVLGPLLALTRFIVCLNSLEGINRPPGEDSLDVVGRAFFKRQMARLG